MTYLIKQVPDFLLTTKVFPCVLATHRATQNLFSQSNAIWFTSKTKNLNENRIKRACLNPLVMGTQVLMVTLLKILPLTSLGRLIFPS